MSKRGLSLVRVTVGKDSNTAIKYLPRPGKSAALAINFDFNLELTLLYRHQEICY